MSETEKPPSAILSFANAVRRKNPGPTSSCIGVVHDICRLPHCNAWLITLSTGKGTTAFAYFPQEQGFIPPLRHDSVKLYYAASGKTLAVGRDQVLIATDFSSFSEQERSRLRHTPEV